MSTRNEGGIPVEASRDNLIEKWVYFADVCNITFQFASIEQVQECKSYFSTPVQASTKETGHELEHYWHPWYSKLPKGINKRSKREKVLKALDKILNNWGNP
jgi:hypothetical protein